MGAKSSKLVINGGANAAAAPEKDVAAIKEVVANGAAEAVATVDTVATNGEAKIEACAEKVGEAIDNGAACVEKCKKSPISWIQKKISIKSPKKSKSPVEAEAPEGDKKEAAEEAAAEVVEEQQQPEEEKKEEEVVTNGVEESESPVKEVDQSNTSAPEVVLANGDTQPEETN